MTVWDLLTLAVRILALIGLAAGAYHVYRRSSPAGLSGTAAMLIGLVVLVVLAVFLFVSVLVAERVGSSLVAFIALLALGGMGFYLVVVLGTRIVARFPKTPP